MKSLDFIVLRHQIALISARIHTFWHRYFIGATKRGGGMLSHTYNLILGIDFFLFYLDSQNAGLRSAMLAIAVSVRRGSYTFFEKFILSKFHGRFCKQLTLTGRDCAGDI